MTKKYPYTRHLPRTQLVSDKEFELEVISAQVSEKEEVDIKWSTPFGAAPNVTATIALATSGNEDNANVNMFVKEVTAKKCTLVFSDVFTGTVNVQAIRFT
tara:strand:- start:1297 stop:1599 length:303 start_codon:yes stop_codon:yes gene_type:complete